MDKAKIITLAISLCCMSWTLASADTLSAETQSAILAELAKEPRIKDAAFGAASVSLLVGVIDDGTRRHGYAMYVCEIVREQAKGQPQGSQIHIRILDVQAAAYRNETVELGDFWCKF